MSVLAAVIRLVLAGIALRGVRWAYAAFILAGLAYFPVHTGFRFQPRGCELVFGPDLAIHSLTNVAHIMLFAAFFVFSSAQTGPRPSDRTVLAFAAIATIVMGLLVELAEGATGSGNCRLRDLIPDSAGIGLGMIVLVLWRKVVGAPSLNPFVTLRADHARDAG